MGEALAQKEKTQKKLVRAWIVEDDDDSDDEDA